MIKKSIKSNLKSGFTLLELAIVLVIVGLLVYASAKISTGSMNVAKISATNSKLDKIQTAIQLYFEQNGYLPCAADGSLAATNGNFGLAINVGSTANAAASGATCTNANDNLTTNLYHLGVVPTRSLSLPDDYMYDAWGNRITYVVSLHCVDADNWSVLNTFKCAAALPTSATQGGLIVIKDNSSAAGNTVNPNANAVYALISHGASAVGAWPRNGGARLTTLCGTTTGGSEYERDNANYTASCAGTNFDANYRDAQLNDGTSANYFDDIVRWQTGLQMYYIKNCNENPGTCL